MSYERGRIVAAPPEVVACLWTHWEVYDEILGGQFGISRIDDRKWRANYMFSPTLSLEMRDAGVDMGRFIYSLSATVLGVPSSTVVTLTYERLTSGNTSVHGQFRSELSGYAAVVEPLVRGRVNRVVDDAIAGGQSTCEHVEKHFKRGTLDLSGPHLDLIAEYYRTAERLRMGLPAESNLLSGPVRPGTLSHRRSDRAAIFVVHGRDEVTVGRVCELLLDAGMTPIVLREQPNRGRTLIEKFEDHANADFAVVLLTADDKGGLASTKRRSLRARQNVVFEMGYFIGRISRGRVCALYADGVELPSDLQGILYVPLDSAGKWERELLAEVAAAGLHHTPR